MLYLQNLPSRKNQKINQTKFAKTSVREIITHNVLYETSFYLHCIFYNVFLFLVLGIINLVRTQNFPEN